MTSSEPVSTTAADVLVETDGSIATITLNRREARNAQTPRMWSELARTLDELAATIRVVVVRGAGGTFSAGLDLSMFDPAGSDVDGNLFRMVRLDDQAMMDTISDYQRPFTMLANPRFITVALVEGHAIGAGFQLALACDIRVVADDAQFCMKEPALGIVPDLAGTKPLVAAVGYARALEICATARVVTGREAGEIGLAQVVAPTPELDAALDKLTHALAKHSHQAVAATKALLQSAPSNSLDEQRLAERTTQVPLLRAVAANAQYA